MLTSIYATLRLFPACSSCRTAQASYPTTAMKPRLTHRPPPPQPALYPRQEEAAPLSRPRRQAASLPHATLGFDLRSPLAAALKPSRPTARPSPELRSGRKAAAKLHPSTHPLMPSQHAAQLQPSPSPGAAAELSCDSRAAATDLHHLPHVQVPPGAGHGCRQPAAPRAVHCCCRPSHGGRRLATSSSRGPWPLRTRPQPRNPAPWCSRRLPSALPLAHNCQGCSGASRAPLWPFGAAAPQRAPSPQRRSL
mmetsp:Transcript_69345/g.201125  ORF Transcript_69345/g.201125 Transcript_69345/m.201125 type:complete len:251 (+) Transcript_69345:293-1045(+)